MAGAAEISRETAAHAASFESSAKSSIYVLLISIPGSGALGKVWEIHSNVILSWFVLN